MKKIKLHKLYNLSYLIRYSNVPRIKDESVAEHSFYVALGVIKLYEEYDFNLEHSISIAVAHDLIESTIGDISFVLKKNNPDIKTKIRKIEAKELLKFPKYIQKLIKEYNKKKTIESIIVHIADTLQCYSYAKHEVKLGNSGYMSKIVKNAPIRAECLKLQIIGSKR